MIRILLLTAVLLLLTPQLKAQGNPPEISEIDFQRLTLLLVNDPTNVSAPTFAKVLMTFTMQTPKAEVVLGEKEMTWIGEDEDTKLLLLAAYVAGNTQSQLDSGVKRDDKYAGLLKLFHIYRTLKSKQKNFKNAELERLIQMHEKGSLLPYIQKLEKESAKEKKKKLDS